MPASFEDCQIQRSSRDEEQGGDEDVWKVLRNGCMIYFVIVLIPYAMNSAMQYYGHMHVFFGLTEGVV